MFALAFRRLRFAGARLSAVLLAVRLPLVAFAMRLLHSLIE